MNTEDQIQKIEMSLEQAKASIEIAEALERLHSNEDFKLVILEGLFKTEASRSIFLKSDPEMQTEEKQKDVNNVITTIGGLGLYFRKIFQVGDMSKRAIVDDQNTREELLEEQLQSVN